MNNKVEVIVFLEKVRTFLYGDLSNFEKLCKEAEEQENVKEKKMIIAAENSNITDTTTTTIQTTLFPNSFQNLESETLFFRSTIPHALAVLSVADLVGFLLGDLPVSPTNTVENLKKFFPDGITEAEIKYLNFFYRNGMVHTFFPKNKFGIKAHSSNPKNTLFFPENDIIVLNANYLIELTQQSLEILFNDKTKYNNMKNQFLKLENHDNRRINQLQPDIDTFKKNGYK